jgi:hypothetical protein
LTRRSHLSRFLRKQDNKVIWIRGVRKRTEKGLTIWKGKLTVRIKSNCLKSLK